MSLTATETERYQRHIRLPEIGKAGQQKLKKSSVLLVGLGGLGSPVALYLAAAGVGRIGCVDFDRVDSTNLHRQILYTDADVGQSKVKITSERLRALNPDIQIDMHDTKFTAANAVELVRGYDVVVDGADNFSTRYLVNDACVQEGKPNVFGAIYKFEGQVSVFDARYGPCYRCLFPESPPIGMAPSCADIGVLGVLPGVVGTLQATEALKVILGLGSPLIGRFLLYDALALTFRELQLKKDPNCIACGVNKKEKEWNKEIEMQVSAEELKAKIDRNEKIVLLDVREQPEWDICHIEGAVLIPLREIPARWKELNASDEIVVFCHHGGRSERAAGYLRQQGFTKVFNLVGGIHAWSEDVDPAMARY